MKKLSLMAMVLVLTSCATTMPGKNMDIKSEHLGVAVSTNPDFTSDNVQMFQISVKNISDEWLSIDNAIVSSAPTSKILLGEKISSWIEACTLEKKVSDYNTQLALTLIAAGGAVVAGTSNNSSVAATGAITALGAISVAIAQDYQESKNKAEFKAAFPEGHVFRNFTIPPKKVIQRWILIENPNKEVPVLTLTSNDKKIKEVSVLLEK